MTTATTTTGRISKQFDIPALSELRIRFKQSGTVELLDGIAQIFGADLLRNKPYTLTPEWYSVTAVERSKVDVYNFAEAEICSDTSLDLMTTKHLILDELRRSAMQGVCRPPCILITGAPNSGVSTLAKFLLNSAVNSGFAPLFVDLDSRLDGTIRGSCIDYPIFSEVYRYKNKKTQTYFLGHKPTENNKPAYENLVSIMAKKLEKIPRGGLIVCAPSLGAEHAIQQFGVDGVWVLGSESLSKSLQKTFPKTVVGYNRRLEGVMERSEQFRKLIQLSVIRDYFYGNAEEKYAPLSRSFNSSSLSVFKRDGSGGLSKDLLPIGAQSVTVSSFPLFLC